MGACQPMQNTTALRQGSHALCAGLSLLPPTFSVPHHTTHTPYAKCHTHTHTKTSLFRSSCPSFPTPPSCSPLVVCTSQPTKRTPPVPTLYPSRTRLIYCRKRQQRCRIGHLFWPQEPSFCTPGPRAVVLQKRGPSCLPLLPSPPATSDPREGVVSNLLRKLNPLPSNCKQAALPDRKSVV